MQQSKKRDVFKGCRKIRGTQEDVAKDFNISTVYLRMIENGTFTPGRDLMFRMSNYFEKPVQELFPDYFKSDN